jgi:hypothetical protein
MNRKVIYVGISVAIIIIAAIAIYNFNFPLTSSGLTKVKYLTGWK